MITPLAIIFLTMIAPILEEADCSVTSWYRTANRNINVHGVMDSKHMTGEALDVACDRPGGTEILIRKSKTMGLKVKKYRDHIHVEVDDEQTLYASYARGAFYWCAGEGHERTGPEARDD